MSVSLGEFIKLKMFTENLGNSRFMTKEEADWYLEAIQRYHVYITPDALRKIQTLSNS